MKCVKPSIRQRSQMSRCRWSVSRRNGLKVCEEQPGDKASVLQPGRPMAWDLPSQQVSECLRAGGMCETSGSTDPTELASFGEEEDDGSMKLKEHFSWRDHVHNEFEH